MRYGQRFRRATRSPGFFLWRWHRQHRWRMQFPDTRRVQQNGLRWLCLYYRVHGAPTNGKVTG
jgi:hypothetical protein